MSLLILESFELVDLPLPSPRRDPAHPDLPSEQERKIVFWTNLLAGAVPLADLRASFDLACRLHEDARRPVNPVEVKQAYAAMKAERDAAARRSADDGDELPDCALCGNERIFPVFFPATGREVTFPCQACRPRAFETATEQWRERNPAPAGPVMQVLTAGRRLIGETLECDSCGREVNTYMSRHKAGGACGGLLNQYSSDDPDSEKPVELCKGKFEKVS